MKQFSSFFSIAVAFAFTLCFASTSHAQLSGGDIMFVGFNADGTDGFAFVALTAIPASTTIYFTDNTWNGAAFVNTEGIITWNSGASIIPAGTVIIISNAIGPVVVSNLGTATVSGSFNLTAAGESLYGYLGTTDLLPTTFLSAFSTNAFAAPNTLVGTGLSAGTNAISLTGNTDVCVYVPSAPCSGTVSACAAIIATGTNWSCEDGAGDQSNDGGIDFPTSVPLDPTVSVLPIELISFKASINEQNLVQLNWQTASESNNDYFEIEKRTNDQDWTVLSKIQGAGNAIQMNTYQMVDESFISELTYFRLSQTDFDGRREYFNIVSVQPEWRNGVIICFPNPTRGEIHLNGNKIDEAKIQIMDNSGRDVTAQSTIVLKDKKSVLIQSNTIFPGIYLLKVNKETIRITIL